MSSKTARENGDGSGSRGFYILAACLVAVLAFLFFDSFLPGKVVWSNDGPYGAISTKAGRLPQGVMGGWGDLNWLGEELMSAAPSFHLTAVAIALQSLGYAKVCRTDFLFLLVGLCAWLLFRQLKFAPIACVLGGLAAALNSDFFSIRAAGAVVAQPVLLRGVFLRARRRGRSGRSAPLVPPSLGGFRRRLGRHGGV